MTSRMSYRGLNHSGEWFTPPVADTLAALRAEYAANGCWPVRVRRLADLAGFRTPSVVHAYLGRLAEAGLVERGPSERDGWRPVEDA